MFPGEYDACLRQHMGVLWSLYGSLWPDYGLYHDRIIVAPTHAVYNCIIECSVIVSNRRL